MEFFGKFFEWLWNLFKLIAFIGGPIYAWLYLKNLGAKRSAVSDEEIRGRIADDRLALTQSAEQPTADRDEFSTRAMIKGSKFINIYPLKDPKIRQLSKLVQADVGAGVCEAFLRSCVDEKAGKVLWHQLYYRTRAKDETAYHKHEFSGRIEDNLLLDNNYEGKSILGYQDEHWGSQTGKLTLSDHYITIPDELLRSYTGLVKFKVSTKALSFIIELPIAHVRAQLEYVDNILAKTQAQNSV
jgi:hypothetical protein